MTIKARLGNFERQMKAATANGGNMGDYGEGPAASRHDDCLTAGWMHIRAS